MNCHLPKTVHSFTKICFLTHIVLYVFSICTKIRVLWTHGAHFIWMEKHCFPWLSTAVLRTHFSPNGIFHLSYPATLWKLSKPPAFLSQISLLHISFPFVPGLWISEAVLSHSPSIPPIHPPSPGFHFLHFQPFLSHQHHLAFLASLPQSLQC